MGLYINTNVAAQGTGTTMRGLSDQLAKSQQRLASGVKSVADDASSASVGFAISATISTLTQASNNAAQGSALLNLGMAALSSTQQVLQRMTQLAAQANSNSIDDTRRQMIDQEFQKLLTQVDTNAQTKWFNTQLFTGGAATATGTAFTQANSTIASCANTMSNSFTSTGFVNGQVTAATVIAASATANSYQVSMTVGNQTFQGSTTITANGQSFTLASTSNPINTITLTTGSNCFSAGGLTSATAFQTALQTIFGVSNPASQVLGSTAVSSATGMGTFSGGSATPGFYGISYVPLANGTGGTFTLTNGAQSWSQTVTGSASSQTVTFGNGLSFVLAGSGTFAFGTPFSGGSSQGVQVVAGTGSQSFTFQTGQASTDTTSVTFSGAGTVALGLSGLSVATTSGAATATTAILTAMTTLSSQIAVLGGVNSQLGYLSDNLAASIQNQTAAKATFTDIDVADQLTAVQRMNAGIKIAQTMFAQSMQAFAQKADLVQTAAR